MVERRQPIWVKDAVDKVMQWKKRGEVEWISIDDCEGLFLAEPLNADHDVPPFNRSPYDGFAIRSEDTQTASREQPLKLSVIDEIGAGQVSRKIVGENQAVRIMTGAALPAGTDAVIMLELVKEERLENHNFIWIKRRVDKDENVSFQGEDAQKGEVLLKKGTYINPGVKALLATFGYHRVPVSKKPVIGIIATGSELLKIDEPLLPGKIRNSNGYMIEAQIKRAGGSVIKYQNCADDLESLHTAVQKAMDECDAVITTGGVSVGDFDYLPEVYRRLKADILFNKIAMRPGSVTSVAVSNEKLLFGLSGNPSACYVGFELYVRPVIRYWLHSSRPFLRAGQAFLKSDFPKSNPFNRFVRSKTTFEGGTIHVHPVGLDKSSVVTSLSLADCLMVLPGGTRGYRKGDLVDVLFLDDQTGSEEPWKEKPRSSRL
ncbi:gephyrin-like molybdotransferase Glp [Heyndrickxia acidicola]|uniref:Molybdopterin molybdenumtransferase n=1 Tax=Heyndrickxia acidicola TaxID=209389 RepID=A0ABU6ME47_9BACI|nr:gephyrin-like molybdotransferase Glp [Heyndrickxia acidicola]MED1201557.1 molybdopterin molybdotransferase MoeA [Heyndrickxia acidicola]